eukprot:jgi/Botrbrau1/4085/Bobra.152_3s0036.1
MFIAWSLHHDCYFYSHPHHVQHLSTHITPLLGPLYDANLLVNHRALNIWEPIPPPFFGLQDLARHITLSL